MSFFAGDNAGGEAAHLAGMAAGAVYVLWRPWIASRKKKSVAGAWAKKVENRRQFEAELDRILTKVHQTGITSLSKQERRVLQHATRLEQEGKR